MKAQSYSCLHSYEDSSSVSPSLTSLASSCGMRIFGDLGGDSEDSLP